MLSVEEVFVFNLHVVTPDVICHISPIREPLVIFWIFAIEYARPTKYKTLIVDLISKRCKHFSRPLPNAFLLALPYNENKKLQRLYIVQELISNNKSICFLKRVHHT